MLQNDKDEIRRKLFQQVQVIRQNAQHSMRLHNGNNMQSMICKSTQNNERLKSHQHQTITDSRWTLVSWFCVSFLPLFVVQKNLYKPDALPVTQQTLSKYRCKLKTATTRMWANAKRDGRPAEYRRRPLFNAAKCGWCPLPECCAVTLPRSETHWN